MSLKCFDIDRDLPRHAIWDRVNGYKHWKNVFQNNEGGIEKFAEGYKIFGMNRNAEDTGFVFREYLPGAKQVFLIGEFNNWENTTPLKSEGFGRWSVELPDKAPGQFMIPHRTKYKMRLESVDGSWHDRVPAWTKVAWQDGNKLFDAAMWEPPAAERYQFKHPNPAKPVGLKIYESHVGMSSPECKINTYLDFADNVLPRIKRLGYNSIQLMAVAEHAYYGCFGYHVTSFFAASSRFGTPDELKYLVDRAHGMGIQVLVDLVHAHCSSNANDGIAMLDGTDHCYTHSGLRGYHSQWDSRLFNYENYETLRFLLSNVKWWLDEYRFDGFRFDGVSSMLYHSHAIGKDFHDYFGPDADLAGHVYLMLANDVIKATLPSATTVAEDVSGMPTLALPIEWGGFGFDARLAMAIPDMWIKILKEGTPDENWDLKWIAGELQNRRRNERSIAYAESHDQAIVGDKTIAFWLMDAEMYTGMSTLGNQPSMCIQRGLALHKMIRMVCLSLGEGYLNFCGNEFGHPEWVDFPREGNGWSYLHANRRYDLPDMDHLRYKFLNNFDMYMQQVENRFKFLSDWHFNCTMVNNQDKIIVVERGECLIVMNFHPHNSYTDYQIGHKWNEPLRMIMDSDEERFGGHSRLQWGHDNSFPVGHGFMQRPHSTKLYLPARTVQILTPERHLFGGVRVVLDDDFAAVHGAASGLSAVLLQEWMADGVKHTKELETKKFDNTGILHVDGKELVFALKARDGTTINCATENDGHFHCLFPGLYAVSGLGYIRSFSPWEADEFFKTHAEAKVAAPADKEVNEASEAQLQAAADAAAKAARDAEEEWKAGEKARQEAAVAAEAAAEKIKQEQIAKEKADKQAAAAAAKKKAQQEAAEADAKAAAEKEKAQKMAEEAAKKAAEQERLAKEKAKKDEELAREKAKQEAEAAERLVEKAMQESGKEPDNMEQEMVRCPSMHLFTAEDAKNEQLEKRDRAESTDDKATRMEASKAMLASLGNDMIAASQSYKEFGLHQRGDKWSFREWVPGATSVNLVGEFNNWDTTATPLVEDSKREGVWSCEIVGPQAAALQKGQKYKMYVTKPDSAPLYVTPAWATKMVHTKELNIMDAVAWPVTTTRSAPAAATAEPAASERIYECHLGLAARPGQPKSFREAAQVVIPRAKRNGYTALLLVGVVECKNYADMGALPCALFAPTSLLGLPEELQDFVREAHEAGLRVYQDISHDGAAWCSDGLGDQYFRGGTEPIDPINAARIFDFAQPEVVRYLLSSLSFWMNEYGFDGFRLPRVSSMIFHARGRWLPTDPVELAKHVTEPGVMDEAAIVYLRMATDLVHEQGKQAKKVATVIADDPSLCPGICEPVEDGGFGFDVRQCRNATALFRDLLKKRDEDWCMAELMDGLSLPRTARKGERTLACAESAKDCVVSRKPLKIAFLSWETLHTIAVGGVAPHVTELAAALHGAGHEVHIFTRAQGGSMDNCILGVHYHEVTYDKHGCMVQDIRNMCGAFVWALNGHESVWGAFDIIHGHDWLAGPAICQLKGQGRPVVFTMHSTEGGRNGDMNKGHPGIKDIERAGCGAADRLIAVSGVLRDEVCSACGADGGRMSVIYNGIHSGPIVNMEWHDEWTGNTKRDMGWHPMDPMFLFVGRHTAQKGCDILIEAIPMVLQARGDAKFVIVGDGHLKAMNEARAHGLGLGHAVCFTGSLKSGSAHLKALFKACDAVVVPSRNEPFGIVVLEAWASGKPVVATTSGGPRDFVTPGEDGFLVSPDSGSVAWGCCKILENFEHAKWMGRNAQAKAMREFSWEYIAQETEKVYYSLLNVQGAPRARDRDAGYTLAGSLLRERCFNMGANDGDEIVARGVALLKIMKLMVASLAGDAVLTWMGSEFGQIDALDMPRPANGFNDECGRCKYELPDNADLKFGKLEAFEAELNKVAAQYGWLSQSAHTELVKNEEDKVVAYARGGCVFVVNLHPHSEYKAYAVEVPAAVARASDLRCVLSSSEARFGGSDAVAGAAAGGKAPAGTLLVDLPARTALIFAAGGK
eukprot:TRINITY_DN2401_c0_g1_i1.p1 TRINITY_DN2401_c0_g1~~TRINITY_DN2401_c0_g1_i1.p1  ORF type:complete len:2034 (+),score=562.59 TRINITY_DN2401_c0_g1_i1:70-6171(+)